jgi:hypothetical protein
MWSKLFSTLELRSGDGSLAVAVVEEVEPVLEQGRVV